jgi:hypothetical protein
MKEAPKIVISASRRTDIPAFYLDWFMEGIDRGVIAVTNPYNQRRSEVSLTPDRVHTIVFWSKNFGPFLNGGAGRNLQRRGYHLFFNFTVNSENRLLEPGVPPLSQRLEQLRTLCDRFGPQSVQWRFDPICHYQSDRGGIRDNLHDFETIAGVAASAGITRCITSFMDIYPKIVRRLKSHPGLRLIEAPADQKARILNRMHQRLNAGGIQLFTCCEKEALAAIGPAAGIKPGSCVPNDLFLAMHGGSVSCRPDRGQRIGQGCGCLVSTDIGSYLDQPCLHKCLYCYANR